MEPQIINNRYDFVYLFDVVNGNPNGDPDEGNAPRTDPETQIGLVSDVCIKRKIRNFLSIAQRNEKKETLAGYDIYVKEKAILNRQHQRAYDALKLDSSKDGVAAAENVSKTQAWMCQNFFDIRMFGAVMSTDVNCGQVRGPVQITFSHSIDPIIFLEESITRMAVTTEKEAEDQAKKQAGGNRTMGRKVIVPYALYRMHGFVSPHLAEKTGFSEDDLALLWTALGSMFEVDRSASRGEMTARKLYVFKHDSMLGNAPAHKLFERILVRRKDDSLPPRHFGDYEISTDFASLPNGVTVQEML
jgi:CRISPR-associated protein Csd2